ncbi:MAG: DUF1385 domain-containing protein [Dehalococcoidales bacterium]|nr:DUF1385 domain-containing protein [Dehalococcoidales bacterium]
MAKVFHYGGQAVVEGVMMRGQKSMVTAVRRPNGGLAMNTQLLGTIYTGWIRRTPLLRGIIVLLESLVLGIKTLLYSANVSLEEEDEKISGSLVWLMVTVSLILSIALFFLAPLFITKLIDPYINSSILFHLIEGCIRLFIFILYLKLMGLAPDIKRLFAYHGAEHKTVNAYENGVPLEVDAVKKYSTAHVRCGTSFMFSVLIIAILVFAVIGRPESIWLMILFRIILIPLIAGIGYEITHFSGNHTNNIFIRTILYPGLLLQKLTTSEPDDSQLEVAISALKKVVEIDHFETPEPAS